MNIENSEEATSIFIHKKPAKMKIKVTDASYLVQYIEQDGKWYFAYSRASLTFKCRWDNRLFNSNYSIQSEMAVTDRSDDGASKFARKERLKSTDIIAEKVVDFEDENFWEDYNIIEPEQNIENAIKRLSRKLKRRTSE